MNRPTFFFAPQGACCGAPVAPPPLPTVGCLTETASSAYYTLGRASVLNLLGVPPGGNAQAFLKGLDGNSSEDQLVIMNPDGTCRTTRSPRITLPLINPPTSNNYPMPSGFQFLMIATGGGATWSMVAAPTVGKKLLYSDAGNFIFLDAGTIPGIDEIGQTATTTPKGKLLALVQESGVFIVRKLQVADKRLIIGDASGTEGYRPIGNTEELEQFLARFRRLRTRTYEQVDDNDTVIADGLPLATVTGAGSIADPRRIVYSPINKKFYLAPAQTILFLPVVVNSAATTVPTSFGALPSGHLAAQTGTFNYQTVRLDFSGSLGSGATSNTQSFGLYRDGVLIQEFDNDNLQNFAFTFIDQNVTYGTHTYDVRWKRNSGSTQVVVKNTYFTVQTLG